MMRKVFQFVALFALAFATRTTYAQIDAFQNWCQDGGVKVITSGLPSSTTVQASYPQCKVDVYLTGTLTRATIFKDKLGTALTNPFTAFQDGYWLFFAADGQGYDVVMSLGTPNAFPSPKTLTDLIIGPGSGGSTVVQVNGTPIITQNPVNFVNANGVTFTNPSAGIINAAVAGAGCGPLAGDSTSTNCGTGNFAGTTVTQGLSTMQAYGFTNLLGLGSSTLNGPLIGIGTNTLFSATPLTGVSEVVAIGDSAARSLANSSQNFISIGLATSQNAGGNNHIDLGQGAGTNSVGREFISIGDGAGVKRTGSDIISIGDGAGSVGGSNPALAGTDIVNIGDGAGGGGGTGITQAGHDLVSIGNGAGGDTNNAADIVAIGEGAGSGRNFFGCPVSGHDLVAIGNHTALSVAGAFNVAIGFNDLGAGLGDIFSCHGFTSGSENTAIGDTALAALTTGSGNLAIGQNSGSNGYVNVNTIGNSNQTGSNNTWVGTQTGPNTTTQLSNTIGLGFQAINTQSNQTVIGNPSTTQLLIFGSGDGCLSSSSGVVTGSGVACGSGGGGSAFSAITGSTNTTATMVVGTGATLSTAGSGTIAATSIGGITVTGTPAIGNVLTATSTSAANWQAPSGGGAVSSVSNSDGTLTISPTTGAVVASLALGHANTWAATQTLSGLTLSGITGSTQCLQVSTSGVVSGTGSVCGTGGGSGTVTNFIAATGSWPTWLVPSVATSTTTPTLSVVSSLSLANVAAGASPTGLFDFSGATAFKVPIHTTATAAASGEFIYDSTNGNMHMNVSSTDLFVAGIPSGSPPTNGHCAQFTLIAAWWEITDAGAPCGSGGGGTVWSALTNPSTNLALTMGSDTTTFTFGATTGSADLFKWTDTTSNTGTGILGHFTTAASSTEIPWQADANGIGWRVATDGSLRGVGSSSSHGMVIPEGPPLTGVALSDVLTADSTTHRLLENPNNVGAVILSGTAAARTSGNCVAWAANGIDLVDAGGACGISGGGSAFSAITTGANTTATMTLGTGSSLITTGTGVNQATIVASEESVSFSTTPTFSTSFRESTITLTASITSFTLASGTAGQEKTLTFCENSTGGFDVTPPANVHGFMNLNGGTETASKCNSQHFTYNSIQTAWIADSPGVLNQ